MSEHEGRGRMGEVGADFARLEGTADVRRGEAGEVSCVGAHSRTLR